MVFQDDFVWKTEHGVQIHQNAKVDNNSFGKTSICLTLFFPKEIQCKDPDALSGVNFEVSTHSVGGIARYSCPRGSILQGNNTRTCLAKGQWSGKAPHCIRMYFLVLFNVVVMFVL